MRSLVASVFLYACESWTLIAELQTRIRDMEMRCYRKNLHISYKNHITSEEVCAKIQQAIGPRVDLTILKRGKLKGGRSKQKRQTEKRGGIREWTGLEFAKSQRAAENIEKWRKLCVKSSVVPKRHPNLRDK